MEPNSTTKNFNITKAIDIAERKATLADRYFREKKFQDAKKLYTEAAEGIYPFLTKGLKQSSSLKAKCLSWINKAENIKTLLSSQTSEKIPQNLPDKELNNASPSDTNVNRLSPQELDILRESSQFNNKLFYPWSQDDTIQTPAGNSLYLDPDGLLELSEKQLKNFGSWKRPSEIFGDKLTMISTISSDNIIQDMVTNCSFVASLCICAAYELTSGKRLITSSIFPQDSNGQPILSPSGKYLLKLHFNGIYRQVLIDDLLPTSKTGELMCTHSKVPGEIWPSLLEKAFMKLSGGYSFLGSNSSVDLHSLTGWIPEQIFISQAESLTSLWNRLYEGYEKGFVVATIGTGFLTEESETRLGLISSHAYAVLGVQSFMGLKLLKVKNPWGHYRWKGAFSHLDLSNWTAELKSLAGYDPVSANEKDDGIFWIDFDSACHIFETFNFNWSPDYFPFTYGLHVNWCLHEKDQRDEQTFGLNPQFSLEIDVPEGRSSVVWILVTKHVVTTTENSDYLATHVYNREAYNKDIRIQGHGDSKIKGIYLNSTHILTKFTAPPGTNFYTIILSQKGVHTKFNYTIKIFSMSAFRFNELPFYTHKKISRSWDWESSGGNITSASFFDNPQFSLSSPPENAPAKFNCVITVSSQEDFPLGIIIFESGNLIDRLHNAKVVKKSDVYKLKFNSLLISLDSNKRYTLIPSGYDAGMLGDFSLTFYCNHSINAQYIGKEGEGMFRTVIDDNWEKNHTASIEESVISNYLLQIKSNTRIKMRLRPSGNHSSKTPVNIEVYRKNDNELVASTGSLAVSYQGVLLDHIFEVPRPARMTKATAATLNPKDFLVKVNATITVATKFSITVYHDQELHLFKI